MSVCPGTNRHGDFVIYRSLSSISFFCGNTYFLSQSLYDTRIDEYNIMTPSQGLPKKLIKLLYSPPTDNLKYEAVVGFRLHTKLDLRLTDKHRSDHKTR